MALPNIRSITQAEFLRVFRELGEPAYKAEALKQFLFKEGVTDFEHVTTLSLAVRRQLALRYDAVMPEIASRAVANDGTVKVLLNWAGTTAEAVLMPSVKGKTICLSAQSGCRLRCGFCATGTLGLKRNLTCGEILDQILVLSGEGAISRVVVMGMGEPMENLDELIPALAFAISEKGHSLSRKKVTVSTVGLCPEIERFAAEGPGVELAISLHATTDEIRTMLMPVNKKYPIEMLMRSARIYAERANAKVTIEYTLLEDVNDTDADAGRLARISRKYQMPVNLIRYNKVSDLPFSPSPRLDEFALMLKGKALGVTVRRSKGSSIQAACGQLAGALR
ncbi:MAG: 23S rRNA (adenine(2503)-C(2))-methyltransferase RlmN [Candidatus Hydrogenedentota bacterium]